MSTENQPSNQKNTPQKTSQDHPPLKCPRCDSPDTKFCYYNNHCLAQPRHMCRSCRRYWTKGGALRNVPLGGASRKPRKLKTASSVASTPTKIFCPGNGTGEIGGLAFKFVTPNLNPGMEFQLGGLSLPRLHPATAGVYTQFITNSGTGTDTDGPYFGLGLLGPNYSCMSYLGENENKGNEHEIVMSSRESISSIEEEMHWKLQQQWLGMIYGPPLVQEDVENRVDDQEEKGQGEINVFMYVIGRLMIMIMINDNRKMERTDVGFENDPVELVTQ